MTQIKQIAKQLFQYETRLVLKKYKPKIIAITGSVGKTTTRDFLYSVLSKKFFVRKNGRSMATEFSVPLTIIGYSNSFLSTIFQFLSTLFFGLKLLIWKNNYPDWLILEIDVDKPGDVDSVRSLLSIDILVVTGIGAVPSHIEFFASDMEKFLAEKKKLMDLVSRDGVIVYNSDDETVCRLVSESPLRKISCGLSGDADVRGSEFEILTSTTGGVSRPTGMRFDITFGSAEREGNIGNWTVGQSQEVANGQSQRVRNCGIGTMDSIGVHNEYAT